jgi:ferredoxin
MSTQPKVVATLLLNPIACDGRGICHDAAPDLIKLDEWGYPLLPGNGLRVDLTKADLKEAEAATHACPALALHIERKK